MKVIVSINDFVGINVDQSQLSKAAKKTAEYVQKKKNIHPRTYEIACVIVSDEEMRRLNLRYRNRDKTTDVLSFGFYDNTADAGDNVSSGEIVISPSQVKKQARHFKHSFPEEFLFLFIHGILHLFGFTDDTKKTREEMERMGHAILSSLSRT